MIDPDRTLRRRAFTLLEMSLSLALTGLVALSAVSVSSILQSPDLAPASAAEPKVALLRGLGYLDELLAGSRGVGYATGGTAIDDAVMVLWHDDTFTDAAVSSHDHAMQLYELRLLHHDPATGELLLYIPRSYADLTRSQRDAAAVTVTQAQFTSEAIADTIRATAWMEPVRVAGAEKLEVLSASFSTIHTGVRSAVTYELVVSTPALTNDRPATTQTHRRSVSLIQSSSPEVWDEKRKLRAPNYSGAS